MTNASVGWAMSISRNCVRRTRCKLAMICFCVNLPVSIMQASVSYQDTTDNKINISVHDKN